MKIIVLIKQVPDIQRVKFDVEKGRIDRSSAKAEINPFDLNALETAVQIKDIVGGKITTLCMGPPQAESALRNALARGADEAILVEDEKFAGSDALATSYTLSCAIKKLGDFDLIVCGEKTVDGDTGQVGPEVAENLNIPHACYVSKIESVSGGKTRVVSEMEGGSYLMQLKLPCLITVTKDINTPRLPKLKDKLEAKKSEIKVWHASDLSDVADENRFGAKGSPTMVQRIVVPTETFRKGLIFREISEGVKKIFETLREEKFI